MRYSWILLAAMAAALAACESSNTRYGLTGDQSQDTRARDYSNSPPADDADRSWENNKQMDESPDAPSHSTDMPR